MAESKSIGFALFINGHSEKSWEFDFNRTNRLADISERLTRPREQASPSRGIPTALLRQGLPRRRPVAIASDQTHHVDRVPVTAILRSFGRREIPLRPLEGVPAPR